jgi:hypothetical protein
MRSFLMAIAALLPALAAESAAAACSGYQFECRYVPGKPDRRPLGDQLQRPIWAPEPPNWPAPPRPELAQPEYGEPSSDFAPEIEDRPVTPPSGFRPVEPVPIPMPLAQPRFVPRL